MRSERWGRSSRPRLSVLVLTVIAALAGGLAYHWLGGRPAPEVDKAPDQPALEQSSDIPQAPSLPVLSGEAPRSDAHAEPEPEPEPEPEEISRTVQKGDTASSILGDYLSSAEVHELTQKCKPVFPLRGLAIGQPYVLKVMGETFLGFDYEINGDEKLIIRKTEEGFQVEKQEIEYEVSVERVRGAIESSLFEAVGAIGESPEIAVRMADIFAWDIDFIRDLRKGDTFTVLVEKRTREGAPAGYGRILAARFVNQGNPYFAYLFEDQNGFKSYYDETGRSLRKAFLKAPLDFKRISSGFTMSRLHPVLGIRRPHPGIDYAAPKGTPVKSVGDGSVLAVTQDKAAGKYVKIRHVNGYETTYMHLNGWARGVRKGVKVRQGQVIGYVGATGLATGPHLDFRIKKNGTYINPSKIQTPAAESVSKKLMPSFRQTVEQLRHGLGEAGPVEQPAEQKDGEGATAG